MTRAHYERAPRFTFREEEARQGERRALILILCAAGAGALLHALTFWRVSSNQRR
jgi:hypothetical protein